MRQLVLSPPQSRHVIVPPLIPSCITTVVVLPSPPSSLSPLPLLPPSRRAGRYCRRCRRPPNVAPPQPSSPPFSPFLHNRCRPPRVSQSHRTCFVTSFAVYTGKADELIPKSKTAERDMGLKLPQAATPSRFKTSPNLASRIQQQQPINYRTPTCQAAASGFWSPIVPTCKEKRTR